MLDAGIEREWTVTGEDLCQCVVQQPSRNRGTTIITYKTPQLTFSFIHESQYIVHQEEIKMMYVFCILVSEKHSFRSLETSVEETIRVLLLSAEKWTRMRGDYMGCA